MPDYSIVQEDRVIGGALFDLSFYFVKRRGYCASANPAEYTTTGGIQFKSVSVSMWGGSECIESATRFNRKAGEALIPKAREVWRKQILDIVRKEVSDRNIELGMTASNALGVWETVREQVPPEMSGLIAKLDKVEEMLNPHQAAFSKADILLKLALDGLLPVPKEDSAPVPPGFRYGGILAFIEIYDDAKANLLEWGKTCGDVKAQEMIQQWESVVGATPEKAEIKAKLEQCLLNLLLVVKTENVTA